jgi:hypothetical protein
MKPILFFDIETRARPDAVALLPAPQAPPNYKDPQKIADYIAEKRAAQLRDAALDPDTGEIIAIAVKFTGEEPAAVFAQPEFSEKMILNSFWSCAAEVEGRLAGYNILGFDLPFILRRSMALNVPPSIPLRLNRYQTEPITDLYGLLYGWQPGKGLKTVARLYGLGEPLGDLDGGDVAAMDTATLAAYATRDVDLCVALYQRMAGVYFPDVRSLDNDDDSPEFPF